MKKKLIAVLAAIAACGLIPAAASAHGGNHWCRQGDPPIQASWRTSCAFAGNIVNAQYQGRVHGGHAWVYSSVTHRSYWVSYSYRYGGEGYGGDWVTTRGANGIWARFYDYN